jgi:hypothetical protein
VSGSQRGQNRGGAQRRAANSYAGTLALAALLSGMLAAACVLVFQHTALLGALQRARGDPLHLPPGDAATLGVAFGIVVAAMLAAVMCAATAIRVMRRLLFTSSVHSYAGALLRRAPLHQRGIAPRVVPFAGDGQPDVSGERPLEALLRQTPRLLLLGEAGSGKTIGILAYAAGLTSTRSFTAAIRSRTPLPLPVSLRALPARADAENVRLLDYLATQVERFGSAGLAARLPRLLRRGRLLLLCDDLDAVPPSRRAALCAALAECAEQYPRTRIVVACCLNAYEDDPYAFVPLRGFTRAVVSGLAPEQVRAALAGVSLETAVSRPKRLDVVSWLRAHALTESVSLASISAALLTVATSSRSQRSDSVGRGELLARAVHVTMQAAAADEEQASSVRRLLQELAAALRTAGRRSFPAPGEDGALAIAELLAYHLPQSSALPDEETQAPRAPEAIARGLEIGLSAGILVCSPDGTEVTFAHGLVEAACAAGWLSSRFAAAVDLPPALLREPWHLSVLLWAGIERSPGSLAERLLRLVEGQNGAALGGATETASEAATEATTEATSALSLALAALAESCVCALTRASGADAESRPNSSGVDQLNERLRDVLDRGLVALDTPAEAERLGRALRSVARTGGPEVAVNLGALASDARLSRLVRSQLALMLGLLATPSAAQALVGLLGEMDVLIRQSVNQAFMRLGEAGRAPLNAALNAAEERVRDRASEVLRLLDGHTDELAGKPAPARTPSATRRKSTNRPRNTAAPRHEALKRDES